MSPELHLPKEMPTGADSESSEARLKRMRMRSWRRGTKEMDLALGPFADARLAALGAEELADYDRLLSENDQDLMAWLLGTKPTPAHVAPMLAQVADFMRQRLSGGV